MKSLFLSSFALKYVPVSFLRRILLDLAPATNSTIRSHNQLLIDVSVITKEDAGTGIQRVVRNLYQELLSAPPKGYILTPIAATRKQSYHYISTDFLQFPKMQHAISNARPVQVHAGDLFLGLDLAAHIIPRHMTELLSWKQQGVRLCFIVYDLLPVFEPAWFNKKTAKNFKQWLRAIAILADDVIAISRAVQADFHSWMGQQYNIDSLHLPCARIMLGAELNSSKQILQNVTLVHKLPSQLLGSKFVLMVGTIEPRKGHSDVINAIEKLWLSGETPALVIAGKQGWKVESLMHRLKQHPEFGKRLHWINSPSDDTLLALYQNCSGLIMASKGEGFGLPLIEAAFFKKPILARDIPVFKEIAGDAASYFSTSGHQNLIDVLPQWLMSLDADHHNITNFPSCATWQESCTQLVRVLLKTSNTLNDFVGTPFDSQLILVCAKNKRGSRET